MASPSYALRIASAAAAMCAPLCMGQVVTYVDPNYDLLVRPTDLGQSAPYDLAQHRPANILDISLGVWDADDPAQNLFAGLFDDDGQYLRVDCVFDGLLNPPGSTSPGNFEPYRYGPNPLYGFIEIDVDRNEETGGELDAPEFRYLSNIARFGGVPAGDAFDDRVALGGEEVDDDFESEPYIERHGEEFHVAFLGGQFNGSDIEKVSGNADAVFDAAETWRITGRWFHRAHGFEPYSIAFGGIVAGEYVPFCSAQFAHDAVADQTTISFVVPLTNAAHAAITGEPAEPLNHDTSDQTSMLEALYNLVISADIVEMFPTGEPEEVLIEDWSGRNPADYLDPTEWRITALVGASYDVAGFGFVWTDALPNVVRGDFDGEHGADDDDREEIDEFIEDYDDVDGMIDDRVVIEAFAADFWVFDLNYDGAVDAFDELLVSPPGDLDLDDDLDLRDFGLWQTCVNAAPLADACLLADVDGDADADLADLRWFVNGLSGPGSP